MGPSGSDWNADDYARNSSSQLGWANELISKLHLKGGESILDIGCGDGKITAHLAEIAKTGRVVGIDSSESMIRLALRKFPPTTHPNLSFVEMDAAKIDLPHVFDVAFSNAALHWVEDHRAVLRGVRACLKPGGGLLFQMGGRSNAGEIVAAMRGTMARPEWQAYFEGFVAPYHFYGTENYDAWLPECGFRTLRVELIPKDMQHDGPEGLKGWMRTTWFPYTDRLPAELRGLFLDEVIGAYLAVHPVDGAGKTHVGMVRLEVEATKHES